jgi:hypothetical protein
MPLLERPPPIAALRAMARSRQRVVSNPVIARRMKRSSELTFTLPHMVFRLTARVRMGPADLARAEPHGWRAFIDVDGKPGASIEVVPVGPSGRTFRISHVTSGEVVDSLARTIEAAERSLAGEPRSYEPRLLFVSGLRARALWLRPRRGKGDRLVPLVSTGPLRAGTACSAEEFFAAVRAETALRRSSAAMHRPPPGPTKPRARST